MERLVPQPPTAGLDLDQLYVGLVLPDGGADGDRAGVTLGMVSSLDGATAVDGVSGGLGGEADAVAFGRLRAACDVVLVGAGTVREEDYGPPGGGSERRAARVAAGRDPVPALIVVTRSLSLDPSARLFTDPRRDAAVVVATCAASDPDRRAALAEVAEVVVLGEDDVDLAELLRWCRGRGWRRVLCEGGPALNGQLATGDLVDEVAVTLTPQLVAGEAARLLAGPVLHPPRALEPVEVHHHGGELLLRYRVVR